MENEQKPPQLPPEPPKAPQTIISQSTFESRNALQKPRLSFNKKLLIVFFIFVVIPISLSVIGVSSSNGANADGAGWALIGSVYWGIIILMGIGIAWFIHKRWERKVQSATSDNILSGLPSNDSTQQISDRAQVVADKQPGFIIKIASGLLAYSLVEVLLVCVIYFKKLSLSGMPRALFAILSLVVDPLVSLGCIILAIVAFVTIRRSPNKLKMFMIALYCLSPLMVNVIGSHVLTVADSNKQKTSVASDSSTLDFTPYLPPVSEGYKSELPGSPVVDGTVSGQLVKMVDGKRSEVDITEQKAIKLPEPTKDSTTCFDPSLQDQTTSCKYFMTTSQGTLVFSYLESSNFGVEGDHITYYLQSSGTYMMFRTNYVFSQSDTAKFFNDLRPVNANQLGQFFSQHAY